MVSSFPSLWILKDTWWSPVASSRLQKKHLLPSRNLSAASNAGLPFFIKSSRTHRKTRHEAQFSLSFPTSWLVLQNSGHSNPSSEDGKLLSPPLPALQSTIVQTFFSLIAPGHRFCLQNEYPLFPLILTSKQTILEETRKNNGPSSRLSLP